MTERMRLEMRENRIYAAAQSLQQCLWVSPMERHVGKGRLKDDSAHNTRACLESPYIRSLQRFNIYL